MFARTCRIAMLASAFGLAGCATLRDAPPASATGSTPAPPASTNLRSFAEVSKDAKESPGLFRLWQKDDKVWLEIEPGQFDHPYFFSTNLDQG